jgi:hypothetical protein
VSIVLAAIQDTLAIAAQTVPIIGITLLLTELLSAWGLRQRIQVLLWPLLRLARLPAIAAPALVMAFGSALSADTMIAADYRAGRLDRRQTLLAAQANTLPGYLTETFTYVLPVVLPALGGTPGAFYLGAFISAGLIKAVLVIAFGRRLASAREPEGRASHAGTAQASGCKDFAAAIIRAARMFVRISGLLLVASWLTTIAFHAGLLSLAVEGLGPVLSRLALPGSLLVPILGYAVSPLAGATIIGALFKSAAVNAQAATLAALLGSLVSLPVFTLRSSLARNISVFGAWLGIANTLISLGIGMFARLGFILLLPFLM